MTVMGGEWYGQGMAIELTTTTDLAVSTVLTEQLAGAWLLSLRSANTRAAYKRDLLTFVGFCDSLNVEPLTAGREVVDLYRVEIEGQGLAPSTVARRLSAVTSFYAYTLGRGLIVANPAAGVVRPRVGGESATLGLDKVEAVAFLQAAAQAGPRDEVLACLLLLNGLRVSEVIGLTIDSLDSERGYQFVTVVGKGGGTRKAPLSPRTLDAIERATAGRDSGPILLGRNGGPMSRHAASRVVSRLAFAAGIPKVISPHSCRHAYVTLSLDAGVPLRDVQDGAGHASPTTTRRYDRARFALDRSPTHTLTAFLAE